MPSMSYCLFENTLYELKRVLKKLENNTVEELIEKANDYEKEAIPELLQICKQIGEYSNEEE